MSAKADDLLSRFASNIAGAVSQRGNPANEPPPPAPADRFAGAVRSRAFGELDPAAIVAGGQPRTEFDEGDLARLADSIRRYGQLAPIRVRYDESRLAWVVLVGERRLRACRLAGLPRVRVEFVDRAMDDADILAEQVVENAVRADLKPVEQARAFKRLMDLNGWTALQLAETIAVEPSSVYRCLALLKLPEDVAERVDAGEIGPTVAYEISKLQNADDRRDAAAKVLSGGLGLAETTAEVKRRRAPGDVSKSKTSRPRPTVRVHRAGGARITIEFKKAVGPEAVLSAVEDLLSALRAEAAAEPRSKRPGQGGSPETEAA